VGKRNGLVIGNKDQYKDKMGKFGTWFIVVGLDRTRKFIDALTLYLLTWKTW